MTDTPSALDQVNLAKTAHAQEVLDQISALDALIRSKPDLWFGGLPPVFEEILRVCDHRSQVVRQTFAIAVEA